MKKGFILFASTLSIFSLTNCNKNDSIEVIILSGQSNMEGHDAFFSSIESEKIKEYESGHDNVKILYDCTFEKTYKGGIANTSNGKFVDVKFGQGRTDKCFGPEVGFAKILGSKNPNKQYYLIKSCEGSASIFEHFNKETGHVYKTLIDDVNIGIDYLKTLNKQFKITALVWMQGEADANKSRTQKGYYDAELDLISNIKNEFKNYINSDEFIFIDSGIAPSKEWSEDKMINSAKKEVVATNNNYIYTTESETLSKINEYHYDQDSYLKLGEIYANNYLSKIK